MSVKRKANILLESGLPLERCSIQWKIRNFSAYVSGYLTCDSSESKERSLRCQFSTHSGHKWELVINKRTESRDSEVIFWIRLLSSHQPMVNFNAECSLNINGLEHAAAETKFCGVEPSNWMILLTTKEKEVVDVLTKGNSDNCDVAVIDLDMEEWSEKTIAVSHATSSDNTEHNPKKMTKLWIDQAYTDVTFVCQGQKIKAHKVILAASSPVFEAMFKEGTREDQDNNVRIEDMDSNVLEVFLRFLYTGEVDKLDEMYLELFTAADKYDVRPLREICIQHMATNISVDNAVEVLALAERHSIGTVKSSALKFIKTNFVDVVKTDSWSSLLVNQLGATKRMSDGGCQSGEITPTNKK